MPQDKTAIYVFAHWVGMKEPQLMGVLSAHQTRGGRKNFSFEYAQEWFLYEKPLIIDPDLELYEGPQYPKSDEQNFGVFLDSMPDRWGRVLMNRRERQRAKNANERPRNLYELDYLLGVHDSLRMGGLRFKLDKDGEFLDNNQDFPTPPITTIRALQYSVTQLESDKDDSEIKEHLDLLVMPGSSLGGARPKANVLDDDGHLWIAKFASKNDTINKAAWEMLAYRLALDANICMSVSRLEKGIHNHNIFLTKRFDRLDGKRVHFASAMTMLGKTEDSLRREEYAPSYLDLVDFIECSCSNPREELHKLWRRIVFNMAIKNTDDHLRNHGFIIRNNEWYLSPAFDINPSVEKNELVLSVDGTDHSLDLDLAKEVGNYFRLDKEKMNIIIEEVKESVKKWRTIAADLGIPRKEQEYMSSAFMWES